jgi:transcriptional repressor NrdR
MRLVVVKRDGRREPFDRSKVLRGLTVACEKRPVATDILEDIVDRIERHIVDSNTTEIESMSLGEMAMQELRKVDKVAYVRFASVYRQFEDIGQFRTIIDGLGDRSAQRKPIKR